MRVGRGRNRSCRNGSIGCNGNRCLRCKRDKEEVRDADQRERSREKRIADVASATDRPEGVLEAGNTTVDGNPAYYEDGGSTGQSGRRERYSGPNGPLGDDHHHDSSTDKGRTWWRWH